MSINMARRAENNGLETCSDRLKDVLRVYIQNSVSSLSLKCADGKSKLLNLKSGSIYEY